MRAPNEDEKKLFHNVDAAKIVEEAEGDEKRFT